MPVHKRNLFSVADTLDETVNRLSARLEILNNQLPQQIVWQAGLLVEQRLGDVEELLRSEQDIVGLIGLAFEHVGRGGRNKRVEHGGAVDDRVAASGLDAECRALDVAQQGGDACRGVEEESVACTGDLERAGLGHGAGEHAAPGRPRRWYAQAEKREARFEYDGIPDAERGRYDHGT